MTRAIELRSDKSEIHKMKTRCFDHIDLRVKDMEVAKKFYGKFLPELGFVHESPGDDFHTFYAGDSDRPSEFFAFDQDKNHRSIFPPRFAISDPIIKEFESAIDYLAPLAGRGRKRRRAQPG